MTEPKPLRGSANAEWSQVAVHANWTKRGIGRGLLKDAIQRTLQLAGQMGIRALLCHAIDEEAKAFYLKHGFIESLIDPMTVMLGLARLQEALSRQASE